MRVNLRTFSFSSKYISSNIAAYRLGSRHVAGIWLPEKLPTVIEKNPLVIHVWKR